MERSNYSKKLKRKRIGGEVCCHATETELMLMRRPGQARLIAGLYYALAACSRSLKRALIAP